MDFQPYHKDLIEDLIAACETKDYSLICESIDSMAKAAMLMRKWEVGVLFTEVMAFLPVDQRFLVSGMLSGKLASLEMGVK
jgi:hypothetical protein